MFEFYDKITLLKHKLKWEKMMKVEKSSISPYEAASFSQCIYCDSTSNLTDEHIIPRGMGGKRYLASASCENCAKITSKFERDAQNHHILAVRRYLKLSDRHKKRHQNNYSIYRGSKSIILKSPVISNIPFEDLPVELRLPLYPDPGIFTGDIPRGIHNKFSIITDQNIQPDYKEKIASLHNLYGYAQPVPTEIRHESWLRMLAKIAYCSMAARKRFYSAREFIRPLILRPNANLAGWVGGGGIADPSPKNFPLHMIRFGHLPKNHFRHIFAEITLFSHYRVPKYLVFCGVDTQNSTYGREEEEYICQVASNPFRRPRPFEKDYIIWSDGFMSVLLPFYHKDSYYPDFREEP